MVFWFCWRFHIIDSWKISNKQKMKLLQFILNFGIALTNLCSRIWYHWEKSISQSIAQNGYLIEHTVFQTSWITHYFNEFQEMTIIKINDFIHEWNWILLECVFVKNSFWILEINVFFLILLLHGKYENKKLF